MLLVNNIIYQITRDYLAVKYLFEENDVQHYLVFQLMSQYLKVTNNKNYVLEWKSKGISDESIKTPVILYWSMAIH